MRTKSGQPNLITHVETTTASVVDKAVLADVLDRIASHPAKRLDELLPWNRQPISPATANLDAAA